jgi:hypothetical protein
MHTPAITVQQPVTLLDSVGLVHITCQFFPDRLNMLQTVTGFDALEHLALGQKPGLRHFAQQMEMIGHQPVV